jgi:hypothetical protein
MKKINLTILFGLLVIAGCGRTPQLEIETFEVNNIENYQLTQLIEPYIFYGREGAAGMYTISDNVLTVRETPDNLARIAEILERYDVRKPSIMLHVDVIEADGGDIDPAIQDIADRLRDLFRFTGYERVAGGVLAVTEGSEVDQTMGIGGESGASRYFSFQARIGRIGLKEGNWTVYAENLSLRRGDGAAIRTSALLRVGQTTLVGTSLAGSDAKALILAVRPEIQE